MRKISLKTHPLMKKILYGKSVIRSVVISGSRGPKRIVRDRFIYIVFYRSKDGMHNYEHMHWGVDSLEKKDDQVSSR